MLPTHPIPNDVLATIATVLARTRTDLILCPVEVFLHQFFQHFQQAPLTSKAQVQLLSSLFAAMVTSPDS